MRVSETMPNWMARARHRRLQRHGDHKVVRWIGVQQDKEREADPTASSHNDNLIAFVSPKREMRIS